MFPEISDFQHVEQSSINMVANDGQIKLTICDVLTNFHCKYWKCNNNF